MLSNSKKDYWSQRMSSWRRFRHLCRTLSSKRCWLQIMIKYSPFNQLYTAPFKARYYRTVLQSAHHKLLPLQFVKIVWRLLSVMLSKRGIEAEILLSTDLRKKLENAYQRNSRQYLRALAKSLVSKLIA